MRTRPLKKLLKEQGFTEVSSLEEYEKSQKEFPKKKVWYRDPICKYWCVNTANGNVTTVKTGNIDRYVKEKVRVYNLTYPGLLAFGVVYVFNWEWEPNKGLKILGELKLKQMKKYKVAI